MSALFKGTKLLRGGDGEEVYRSLNIGIAKQIALFREASKLNSYFRLK